MLDSLLVPDLLTSMLCVELHCHTIYSKDSLTAPAALLATCRRKGIDRLVVTDHNTISGAILAKETNPERFIVGEEIMTTQGELLAIFVREEIPANIHPREVIDRLRSQGAFISVAHPFDRWRSGHWEIDELMQILPLIDAIEIFNARSTLQRYNLEAEAFARKLNLLGTVGSDAHTLCEIGKATLHMPKFHDAPSLKAALSMAQTHVSRSAAWVHLASRYAVMYKKLFIS